MIILKKQKWVYIDVPKTASTSIDNLLVTEYGGEPVYWKAVDLPQVFNKHARLPIPTGYRSFATIRNPYDRIVSFWQHCWIGKTEPTCESFEEFLGFCLNAVNNPQGIDYHMTARLYPMYMYLEPLRVDTFVRYENLEKDLLALPFIKNVKNLLKLNAQPHRKTWEEIKTPELTEMVNLWAGKDFELYGYEKQ